MSAAAAGAFPGAVPRQNVLAQGACTGVSVVERGEDCDGSLGGRRFSGA